MAVLSLEYKYYGRSIPLIAKTLIPYSTRSSIGRRYPSVRVGFDAVCRTDRHILQLITSYSYKIYECDKAIVVAGVSLWLVRSQLRGIATVDGRVIII